MMTDPIADMLTRIRNASRINRENVSMPASREKVGIASVLMEEGFITSYEVHKAEPASRLDVKLKFGPDGEHVLRHIERVSKPGRRVYTGVRAIPRVLRGMGICVLSTPKGILSDRKAREENVGGELLCKVY